jgi:hypothetical protein
MSPFTTHYHYNPVMQFKAPKKPPSLNSVIHADNFAVGLEEPHLTLHKTLQEAEARQMKYPSVTGGVERR